MLSPSEMEAMLRSVDLRTTRLEQILPTLATKEDVAEGRRHALVLTESVRDDIRMVAESLVATQADLRATKESIAAALIPLARGDDMAAAMAGLATKEEVRVGLAGLATKKEVRAGLARLATKEELTAALVPLATKEEVTAVRDDISVLGERLAALIDRRRPKR